MPNNLETKSEADNLKEHKKAESNYRISEGMSPTPSWDNMPDDNTSKDYNNNYREDFD
jgi:hypothetical protein